MSGRTWVYSDPHFYHGNICRIDRIDTSKGYLKDNIKVISWRANRLKSDGTLEELEKIVNYMRKELTNV
jgi:hypothetical protein